MELEQAKLALEMRKIEVHAMTADPGDAEGSEAVSYTHLTLPTNREV